MLMMVKFRFENSNKIFDFCISDSESVQLIDQQKTFLENLDYDTYDFRKMFHLFNPETQMFILNTSELKSLNLSNLFLMKNCSDEAKYIVSTLDTLYNDKIGSGGKEKETDSRLNTTSTITSVSSSSGPSLDIKTIVFKLKNYLSVDIFAEEFISYEGIKRIIDIIKITSGNTRSYAINALKSLLVYLNCMEYIKENSDVIIELYNILINNDNINTINHTLGILILIGSFVKEESVDLIYKAAEEHAFKNNSKIFQELVLFINDSSIDIKVNAITMIVLLVKLSRDRNLQAKLLVNLHDVELHKVLEKNSECKSQEFQIQLSNYQKLTGDIVRGSNYEVELYKKKMKELEKHCQELEKKVEFVFLNQKFYEEIVDDFIYFKKLSDVCSDIGGYYDPYCPTERYDQRINKKVSIDQHGLINLRKLAEDSRIEETAKIKKLQHELDNLKTKYYDLKTDFELISLNNGELKANIYSIQDKNKSLDQINQELIIAELKEENNNLMRKIEILVNKINSMNEDISKAKEEIKVFNENKNKNVGQLKHKVESEKQIFKDSQLQIMNIIKINFQGKLFLNTLGCQRQTQKIDQNSVIPFSTIIHNIPSIPVSIPLPPTGLNQNKSIPQIPSVLPNIPGIQGGVIPNIPGIPGGVIPKIPGIPGGVIPNIPGIPKIPGGVIPNIPGIPGIPGGVIPNIPGIPGGVIPNIPGIPSIPGGVIPNIPGIPKIPGGVIPNIQGIPGGVIPNIPGIPKIPGRVIPNIPGIPGIPGGSKPNVPGIPNIPGIPGGSKPNVPGIPGIPGGSKQNVPGIPGAPTISGPPSVPGIPGRPQVPVVATPIPQQVVYKPTVSKPAIKLDKKVKNIHWTRVLLLPKQAPNRAQSIWDHVQEIPLDLNEVSTLFEAKASAPVTTISAKVVTNAKKKFFNDKRAQGVGIVIAKMPPIIKIEEALIKMDEKLMTRSHIESLYREFIKDDEISEYETMNEPGIQWEKQEEYMIGLYLIPSSKVKLAIWGFILDYQESYETCIANTKTLTKACDEIYKNKLLQQIFSYVLTIGNILNAGSTKGQADGFSLEILTKLSSVKDNKGKTVINYICSLLKKEEESLENIKNNFLTVTDASKMSFAEVFSGLNKLKKDCREQTANILKVTVQDEFTSKAKEILEKFAKQLEEAEIKYAEAVKYFQEVVTFHGYTQNDAKYKNPEEFFNLLNEFIQEVDRSIPKNEPKKVFNRKHEVGKKVMDNSNNMDALLKQLKSTVS